MSRVAIVYAGGTIGMDGAPLSPLTLPEMRARFEAHCREVADGAEIEWHGVEPAIDSSATVPDDWLRLARVATVAAEGARGVVVLHGTDTLAWSAASLAFLTVVWNAEGAGAARLGAPVVVTGAQRPLFEGDGVREGTDALANLRLALREAATGGPGVRVAFGGRIMPGERVLKLDAAADAAFCATPSAPSPVALADAPPVDVAASLDALARVWAARQVVGLSARPSAHGAFAAAARAVADAAGDGLGAVHLSGYGLGTVPDAQALAELVTTLRARGVPTLLGTQCAGGPVDPGAYATGGPLIAAGAIPQGWARAPEVDAKAHVALALAACHGWPLETLERVLARDPFVQPGSAA